VTLWNPEHGGHAGFASGGFPGHLQPMHERVAGWLRARAGV